MILGLGQDITSIPRMEKALGNERFLQRVFTPAERESVLNTKRRAERAAANFAAKEALAKALGCGMAGVAFNEVSVLRGDKGAPYIVAEGGTKQRLAALGVTRVWVSLSHDGDLACAVVVLEGAAGEA